MSIDQSLNRWISEFDNYQLIISLKLSGRFFFNIKPFRIRRIRSQSNPMNIKLLRRIGSLSDSMNIGLYRRAQFFISHSSPACRRHGSKFQILHSTFKTVTFFQTDSLHCQPEKWIDFLPPYLFCFRLPQQLKTASWAASSQTLKVNQFHLRAFIFRQLLKAAWPM